MPSPGTPRSSSTSHEAERDILGERMPPSPKLHAVIESPTDAPSFAVPLPAPPWPSHCDCDVAVDRRGADRLLASFIANRERVRHQPELSMHEVRTAKVAADWIGAPATK